MRLRDFIASVLALLFYSLSHTAYSQGYPESKFDQKMAESFNNDVKYEGFDVADCNFDVAPLCPSSIANNFTFRTDSKARIRNGELILDNGNYVLSNEWATTIGSLVSNTVDPFEYSVDYRVKVTDIPGSTNTLGIYETLQNENGLGGISIVFDGATSTQKIYYGLENFTAPVFETEDDDFVDIRVIARREASGPVLYSLIVNGKRTGTDLPQTTAYSNLNRMILGDIGSNHSGELVIDHIAFGEGIHGPGKVYRGSNVENITDTLGGNEKTNMEIIPNPVIPLQAPNSSTPALMTFVKDSECKSQGSSIIYHRFKTGVHNNSPSNPKINWTSHTTGGKGCLIHTRTNVAAGLLREFGQGKYVFIYIHKGFIGNVLDNDCTLIASCDVWSLVSVDNGRTWKDGRKILAGHTQEIIDAIGLSNGHIVVPLTDYDPVLNRNVTRIFVSTDNANSWTEKAELDIGPSAAGTEDGLMLPTIVERTPDVGPPVIEVYMRTTQGVFYKSESIDFGQNWSAPTPSTVAASSFYGHAITQSNGDIAMIHHGFKPTYESDETSCDRFNIVSEAAPVSRCVDETLVTYNDKNNLGWSAPEIITAQAGKIFNMREGFEYSPGVLWLRIGDQWYEVTTP